MLERVSVSAQINNKDRRALRDGNWQTEQIPHTSEPIIIIGRVGELESGRLYASLRVMREFNSETDSYLETERHINLGNIHVQPNHRRKGIGSAMLAELDNQARLSGAEKISGTVNDSDEKETPGLLEFYRKNGFTVGKRDEGWEIVKIFSHKALH